MTSLDDLLTTEELAALIRQPLTTIYNYNRRGGPPRIRIGRRVLYRRGDVLEWLRTRYVEDRGAA